ncbi:MAG: phosphoribosylamine--glycine ligase [bacterium]|nr:phosphoribosylamine--glycine ligase [bacterium]
MKVLVVGSGGREHALCWKIRCSNRVKDLYAVPGNAGISKIAKCIDIKIGSPNYFADLANLVKKEHIDLIIVGPEAPLVEGISDYFANQGLRIFGPNKRAARLEGSKAFAKHFMKKYGIPTADFCTFTNFGDAVEYIKKKGVPIVIKASGLAAGKGVSVCFSLEEAIDSLRRIMVSQVFGRAGQRVVIEEYLEGDEVSILAFVDGETFIPMVSSTDHKRIFDQDKGPNTGGMGAYSPTPVVTREIERRIEEEILYPTVKGLLDEGERYVGVLYLGLMITRDGPKVLEYNIRFGDPETQVILPRLRTDLVEIIEACLSGSLNRLEIKWDEGATVCVVVASGGYPGKYENGKEILGLEEVGSMENVFVFHAGTVQRNGKIVTSGGRVLGVTSSARTMDEAVKKVYTAVDKIHFDSMYYRKDIGYKALKIGG